MKYFANLHIFHHRIVECATAHSEHIGEADPSVRFFRIPTVHFLVNVPLQVLLAYKVLDTIHHPTELRPKAFNGIGVTIADNIFFLVMAYNTMYVPILTQL